MKKKQRTDSGASLNSVHWHHTWLGIFCRNFTRKLPHRHGLMRAGIYYSMRDSCSGWKGRNGMLAKVILNGSDVSSTPHSNINPTNITPPRPTKSKLRISLPTSTRKPIPIFFLVIPSPFLQSSERSFTLFQITQANGKNRPSLIYSPNPELFVESCFRFFAPQPRRNEHELGALVCAG